jgi:dCTP deaminase
VYPLLLSDKSIKEAIYSKRISIDPFDESLLQPASIDLRLGKMMRVFRSTKIPYIDVMQELPNLTEKVEIDEVQPFFLHPHEFALGVILEKIQLPNNIAARLDGKSSLGRLGLLVHSTAGWVDPGWNGHLTLELSNVGQLPISLYFGMKITQISFLEMTTPADRPYGSKLLGSKYQGQAEPTPSKYYLNYSNPKNKPRLGM